MNRRVVLRNLSLAVAGTALSRRFVWSGRDAEVSYSIITDSAGSAIAKLRELGLDHGNGFLISRSAIVPSHQDIAVVRSGELLHPDELEGWAADLMIDLRSRSAPGWDLVTVERAKGGSDQITGCCKCAPITGPGGEDL